MPLKWKPDHMHGIDQSHPDSQIIPLRLTRNPTAPTRRMPEQHTKGWGHELWLADTPQYCGKLLCFNQGAKFSAHFHDLKNETFYVLKGRVKLTWFNLQNADEITEILIEGEVIDIPRLCVHQVEALEESIIIEVSTQHLDSDSYRVRKGDSQKPVVQPTVEELVKRYPKGIPMNVSRGIANVAVWRWDGTQNTWTRFEPNWGFDSCWTHWLPDSDEAPTLPPI